MSNLLVLACLLHYGATLNHILFSKLFDTFIENLKKYQVLQQ